MVPIGFIGLSADSESHPRHRAPRCKVFGPSYLGPSLKRYSFNSDYASWNSSDPFGFFELGLFDF